MEDYIQIDIPVNTIEQSDMLVSELSEINFESFEEKDNLLCAFIKEENFNEILLKQILSKHEMTFTKEVIKPTNWNQKWESEYPPVIVDNLVAVRAFFHQPVLSVKDEILITPKMSFGTGHHATTFLMLQQMAGIDFTYKSVLDFGTGTGVLAIYASKLGARAITAIDNDDWSIENAKENFANNDCNIELIKRDTLDFDGEFDIILANINLNVISKNIAALKRISNASSIFLISGILKSNEIELVDEFKKQDIKVKRSYEKDDWMAIVLTR